MRAPLAGLVFASASVSASSSGSTEGGSLRARARAGRERAAAHGERARAAAERVECVPVERAGDSDARRVLERAQLARTARADDVCRVLGVFEDVRRAPHRVLHAPTRRIAPARAVGPRAQLVRARRWVARPRRFLAHRPAARARTTAHPCRSPSSRRRRRCRPRPRTGAPRRRMRGAHRRAPRPRIGTKIVYRRLCVVYLCAAAARRGLRCAVAAGRAYCVRVVLGEEIAARAARPCMSVGSYARCRPPIPLFLSRWAVSYSSARPGWIALLRPFRLQPNLQTCARLFRVLSALQLYTKSPWIYAPCV
jgi:hypothetical protein